MDQFDVIVIGAGPGGAAAAKRAAKCGAQVALIEKEHPGGTCLNWGCIPTKAILRSTHLYDNMKKAESFGLSAQSVSFDFQKIIERKDSIVEMLRAGNLAGMKKLKTLRYFSGSAILTSQKIVNVFTNEGEEEIQADKIVIASGSRPRALPFLPFDGVRVLDSKQILSLTSVPQSLVIIGGGAIGCEFADVFNALGVSVTVIEMAPHLLPIEDAELGKRLGLAFKKKGISVITKDALKGAEVNSTGVTVTTESDKEITADMCLVAIGRVPNTDEIGLEKAGVDLDGGYIGVDEYCETKVSGVYAIGDVTDSPQLAHVAMQEGRIAGYNVTHGNTIAVNYDVIPSCVFTYPEIASLGLTLESAKQTGIDAAVAKELFSANGKAHCDGTAEGFVKLVYDTKTGVVIGGQIMGPGAADIICEIGLAVSRKCTLRDLAFTMHQHPTLTEAIQDAALNAFFSSGCFA